MKPQLLPFVLSPLLALTLSACSGSGSSSSPSIPGTDPIAKPAAPANPTAVNAVAGPELKGRWMSACSQVTGGKFVRLTYEFKANQVVDRSEDIYNSSTCDHVTDFKEQVGHYRYVQKYGDDIYDVEFNLPISGGNYEKVSENIRYQTTGLTVSYRADGSGVKPDIALVAVDADNKPLPTPTPGPATSTSGAAQPAAISSVCKNGEVKSQMEAVSYSYLQGYDNCNIGTVKQVTSDSASTEEWSVGLICDNGTPTVRVGMQAGSDGKCIRSSMTLE